MDDLLTDYTSGLSIRELANKYSTTRYAVSKQLRLAGIYPTPRVTSDLRNQIIAEYKKAPEVTIQGLSEKFGLSRSTIYMIVMHLGIGKSKLIHSNQSRQRG